MAKKIKKIKYSLKLIRVDRTNYAADITKDNPTGEKIEVEYNIFKQGQKKAVYGFIQGMDLGTSKEDIKAMLKQALTTYTAKNQPVPEAEKKLLADREKSDKLKKMEGYKI